MKVPFHALVQALSALVNSDARSSTVYTSPSQRVTASYVHRPGTGSVGDTIAITYGKLNWAGRLFVAKYKRRGEPLPVNQPQLKAWPKARKRRR